jgi:hypothetical protein
MATFRTSAAGGSSSGTGNRTAAITPAVGDLLVVYCFVSTNTNEAPTCSDNNGGGTYDLIDVANVVIASVNHRLAVFVRTALMANTTSTTVTVATGSNTSGAVHVIAEAGMSKVGAAAVRSKGLQNNQAAGTAAPALNQAALTTNPTIVAQGSADTTTTAPTDWTEAQDTNFSATVIALETATRDSGFTGTTITFGAASSTTFCAHALELDASGEDIEIGDTGAGLDEASVAAAIVLAETGAGSDNAAASADPTSTETAPGSEQLALQAAIDTNETGAGTDEISVAVEIVLAETGAGTDAAEAVDLGAGGEDQTATDTGAGSDSAAASAEITLAETAPGSEALTAAAAIDTNETGAGQDTAAASAEITLGEGAPGLDAANAAEEGNPTLSETGPGADELGLQAEIPLGETAPGSDAVFVTVSIAVGEGAPGFDGGAAEEEPAGEPGEIAVGETGAGTDQAALELTVGEGAPGRDRCFATYTKPFWGDRCRRPRRN